MPLPPHFFELTPETLREHITTLGMPAFRANQLLEWVYQKGVCDSQKMTNLSKHDRDTLASAIRFTTGEVVQHQRATDGTQKLLIDWQATADAGGLRILQENANLQTECVMIPAAKDERPHNTACISSQIGCPVGCHFCASGISGLDGNLTAGKIIEQAWQLARLPDVQRISHIVFMGMGEPLSNFDAVVHAVRTLSASWGMGISARRITVSTVGLPAQIRRLAQIDLPITLAISLHAPNDTIRKQIIPWAQFVTIEQLVDAGQYYFQQTGREVTLEYILLGGLNDQAEHARELAEVAKKLRSNVNLIRYNEVRGMPFSRPSSHDVHQFQKLLRSRGVNTHIRASRGRDIAAACGQLRHEAAGA